jgi:hypothetical protein
VNNRHFRLSLALCLTTWLGACTVVYPGNFSYPGVACRSHSGWCIVAVPSVGDLAYGAWNDGELNYTNIQFRLAPRIGVTAAWSASEVTLVDRDTGKSVSVKALDTKPVTGRKLDPQVAEEYRQAGDPPAAYPGRRPNGRGGSSPAG